MYHYKSYSNKNFISLTEDNRQLKPYKIKGKLDHMINNSSSEIDNNHNLKMQLKCIKDVTS